MGGAPVELPASTEFEGRDPFGNTSRWSSAHDVRVHPGVLAAVFTRGVAGGVDATSAWRRGEPILPFGADPRVGDAFYLGFEVQPLWQAGTAISIGLLPAEPDGSSGRSARTRLAINAPGGEVRHHSVSLVWELLTGPDAWTELTGADDFEDNTRALTLDGRVVLRTPLDAAAGAFGRSGQLAWVRATIAGERTTCHPCCAGWRSMPSRSCKRYRRPRDCASLPAQRHRALLPMRVRGRTSMLTSTSTVTSFASVASRER